MSLPEVLLWQELRKRPSGFKFRRQHPELKFVHDFCCLQLRLLIEVDGAARDRGDQPHMIDGAMQSRLGAAIARCGYRLELC